MDKDTTINKVVSGFAWEGSTKLIIQSLTWVTTILVARVLSPEDYGIVAISGVFTGLLFLVTDMGFMSSLINMKEVEKEDYDSVFWLNLLLSLVLFTLLFYMAPIIARTYGSDILADVIRVSALVLPLRSLKIVPLAIAMRRMDFKYRALVEMMGQFVTAVSSIYMAYNSYGVWTLVYSILIGQSVVALAYLPLMKGIPAPFISILRIKNIIPFGMYLTGSDILGFITRRSDVMIMGLFLPEKVVGYYSMGFHLATMPLDKIGAMFNRVAFPSISRVKEQQPVARNIFVNMHKYLLVIAYPLLVGMAILAEELVVLLLTEKWLPAAPVIRALCILNLLRISGMIMPFVISGLGYAKKMFKFTVLSSILLPLAFIIGVQYGLEGVLLGWFIVYPVLYAFLVLILLSKIDLSIFTFMKTFQSAVVCSGLMAVGLYFFKLYFSITNPIIELVVYVVVGMLIYFVAYYLGFKAELLKMKNKIKEMRSRKNEPASEA